MLHKPIRWILGAATILALACTGQSVTGANSTELTATSPAASFDLTSTLTGVVSKVSCIIADTTAVAIGPAGGTITLGGHSLVIPAKALTSTQLIVMLPLLDGTDGVQFLPEGLIFNPKALPTLTLSTTCVGNPAKSYIVYTDDFGRVLEKLATTTRTKTSVSAKIGHFSRYAVAW